MGIGTAETIETGVKIGAETEAKTEVETTTSQIEAWTNTEKVVTTTRGETTEINETVAWTTIATEIGACHRQRQIDQQGATKADGMTTIVQ